MINRPYPASCAQLLMGGNVRPDKTGRGVDRKGGGLSPHAKNIYRYLHTYIHIHTYIIYICIRFYFDSVHLHVLLTVF